MDDWAMLFEARRRLADIGEGLTAEQWDTPSLCEQWKVKHVFAHVVDGLTAGLRELLIPVVKSGFNFNKAAAKRAIEQGNATPPDVMVKELRANLESRKLPPGIKVGGFINDTVAHTQDIRRPLGLGTDIPPETLRRVLDEAKGVQPILGNKKRIAGVKLVATDIDWTCGEGDEVRGPGEAVYMVINGRAPALADLEGPGLATLRSRLSS